MKRNIKTIKPQDLPVAPLEKSLIKVHLRGKTYNPDMEKVLITNGHI